MADDFLPVRVGCWMSLGGGLVMFRTGPLPRDVLSWCRFAILCSTSEPTFSLGSDSLGQMISSCQNQEEKNKV